MSTSESTQKIFSHVSADPFEISYILGGGNENKFSEMGINTKRENPNQIIFSTDDEKNFETLYPVLEEIMTRYRKLTIRTAVVRPEQVAYFRGKNSVHLQRVKEISMVENVYFNDREVGDTKMVEVAVRGTSLSINRFMTELLNSVLNFQLQEMGIKMPPRERKEERESRQGQKE